MINFKLLTKIDNQCIIAKNHNCDDENLFDNMSIVILMKDFFQLISIHEKSL
jgi:hypothetical protein